MTSIPAEPLEFRGPSAALIGWIPYQPFYGGRPPVSFARHRYAKALRLVLRTGNRPEPPSRLLGRAAYDRFIESRNFRAALCLSDVTLTCHQDGRDAEIRARVGDFIGYTPLSARGQFGTFTYDLTWHDKGVGEVRGEIEKYPDRATIRRFVKFRVGAFGNLGSRIATGHWAPYAWMSIAYTMRRGGDVRVEYRGSLIPSLSIYGGWQRRRRHSMPNLTSSQISGFLEAGGNVLAPGSLHEAWTNP